MLCDNLEGWNQRVGGKEAQEEGDICILVHHSIVFIVSVQVYL